MKIYVDLVFIINVFFDFLLLLSVSLALRRNVKIKKLLLGSVVGGLTIIFLFFKTTQLELFFIKFLFAILMCITSFGYRNIIYTLKNFIFLYMISIFLGGCLYFINTQIGTTIDGFIFYNNGFSVNILFIIIITPILLYLYIKELKNMRVNYSKYYMTSIYFKNGENITLCGYFDTGNNLTDPYKNRPIILINYESISKYIIGEKELIVPYKKLNTTDLLRCIKVSKVIINNIEFKNILVGLSITKIGIDGVDCILNNKMEGLC